MLLRGPGDNIQYLETIVTGAPNTGTFTWTPECSLTPDTTHYGIVMFDDTTCDYQYTTQFGLNPGTCSSSSSSSAPPTSSSTPPPSSSSTTKGPSSSGSAPPPPKTMTSSYGSGPWGKNGTASTSTSTYYLPGGTGSPSPSGTYKPIQSNDASRLGMSLVGAAGIIAAAIMIL